jgi:uncharacterized protein (TIGR02679 family)
MASDPVGAAQFLRDMGLARIVAALRERYIALGRSGGLAHIDDATADEQRALASFLNRPLQRGTTLTISLVRFEAALQASRFACSIDEVLAAFQPDKPLLTRADKRRQQAERRLALRDMLVNIAIEQQSTQVSHWLQTGGHGIDWLCSQYSSGSDQQHRDIIAQVKAVALALSLAPWTATPPERLALFARRISGNPHFFDRDQPAGRLLLLALTDLLAEELDICGETRAREDEIRLYAAAGLMIDTISSLVAIWNLATAVGYDGREDPVVKAAAGQVCLVPLRQAQSWQSVRASGPIVYIVENPPVFEEIIDGLPAHHPATLICTAGWPSAAALLLLDRLIATTPDIILAYSGDFDPAGLRIAASLAQRYPTQMHLWRYDVASYQEACEHLGEDKSQSSNSTLPTNLPEGLYELRDILASRQVWAYQEGIAHHLLEDVLELRVGK